MGFPLYFPIETQLHPQPAIAFIENKMKIFSRDKNDEAKYKKALGFLLSGDREKAQGIWKTLKFFPDFNPDEIPRSIVECFNSNHNAWVTSSDTRADLIKN